MCRQGGTAKRVNLLRARQIMDIFNGKCVQCKSQWKLARFKVEKGGIFPYADIGATAKSASLIAGSLASAWQELDTIMAETWLKRGGITRRAVGSREQEPRSRKPGGSARFVPFFLPHISANLTGMLLPSLLGGRLLDQGQNHDFHLVSGESFLYSQSQAYSYIYMYMWVCVHIRIYSREILPVESFLFFNFIFAMLVFGFWGWDSTNLALGTHGVTWTYWC